MELNFDMTVMGSDDVTAGALDRLLLDPATLDVTHVVVRSPHVSEELLLPMSLVEGDVDDRLLLLVESGDLDTMPRYYEGRDSSPPAGRVDTSVVHEPSQGRRPLEEALNVPSDARELGPSARVVTADNLEGRLTGVAVTGGAHRLTQARVADLLDGRDLAVPERMIDDVRQGAITLTATRDQLAQSLGGSDAAAGNQRPAR